MDRSKRVGRRRRKINNVTFVCIEKYLLKKILETNIIEKNSNYCGDFASN